jgi:hypothetical protein
MGDYDLHTSRQIDYYSNCLKMFWLIELKRWVINITNYWKEILTFSVRDQEYQLATKLFSDRVFYKALHEWVDELEIEDFEEKWWTLSSSTFERRKGTIRSWLRWFGDVFSDEAM